ncbi:MAG TPA: hypothetical protein VKV19_17160 [Ktedonobacteraceae bacterium]|nr:hypothetical protein [Ktedonobacteraceae bacterium]
MRDNYEGTLSPLRQQRELRGWSQSDVARQLNELSDPEEKQTGESGSRQGGATIDMIRTWERGIHTPSPFYRRRLCLLFNCSAVELGFVKAPPSVLSSGNQLEPALHSFAITDSLKTNRSSLRSENLLSLQTRAQSSLFAKPAAQRIMQAAQKADRDLILSTDAFSEKDDMDKKRRELLHLLSNAGIALAVPFSPLDWDRIEEALIRSSQIDEKVLHDLEAINRSLWSLFLATPMKASVLDSALGQWKLLLQFLRNPHTSLSHQRLYALASEISQLVGEIFFDFNDYDAAQSCYSFAALAAKEVHAYDLWSCALVRHAFLPLYRKHYEDALFLLREAHRLSQHGDSLLPIQHWIAAVEAEAQSGLLDLVACQDALDRAQKVQDIKETNLPWARFSSTRLPALQGACYIRLHQPNLAASALQEALNRFPKPDRKRGLVLIDLAAASIQQGEAEQACAFVDQVVSILALGSSGFLREELCTLPQRLDSRIQTRTLEVVDQYIRQQLRLPL